MQYEKDQTHLNTILDSLNEGLVAVNKDFRIELFNRAAEKITGYRAGEVKGRICKLVFKSNSCFDNCPLRLSLQADKSIYDMDVVITTKNNERKPICANTALIRNGNGEPVGGVLTFREKDQNKIVLERIASVGDFDGMVGRHPEIIKVFGLIQTIAESNSGVLITGESGTGKEMVANSIQKNSRRKGEAFIKVNCSVFPETLLASELFGHVRGAFTGAQSERIGRFEVADKGTIFLDEIGDIPQSVQLQLLRVLQDGSFERIGESVTRYTNVRVIAATNKDLEAEIEKGRFREDLFYRLNIIPIRLPSLRERRSDIPCLIKFFINKFNVLTGKNIRTVDDAAMEVLTECDWPGNIRQLENAIEYAFAITADGVLSKDSLPVHLKNKKNRKLPGRNEVNEMNFEKHMIMEALENNKYHYSKTARMLGMSRTSLWRKMKQYELK